MKRSIRSFPAFRRLLPLAAGCGLALSSPAADTVLLLDNFNAATGNTPDLNVDVGRQTGTLAPIAYTMPGGTGHQLQNVNAVDQLLVADFPASTSSLNRNFNGADSAGGLKISFDVDSVPTVYGGTPDNWGCINLGLAAADQLANVNQGVPHFGILFRAAGTVQAFDGGGVVSPGVEPVYSTRPAGTYNHIDLVITDTDGNPFDGAGSTKIEVFSNGGPLPVYTFTKSGGGYANNFINLQGSFRAHFDNLKISRLAPTLPIVNPSFEADIFTVFPGYVSGNGPITGWSALGRPGLNPAAGSPFADNGVVPNGSQVGFIQNGPDSSLSKTFPNLTVGETYKVNFRVNARTGPTPSLKVDIDGVNVINTGVTPVGGVNPYKFFAFDFTATAASHTMRLLNDAAGDNTVVIDDFSIAVRESGWSYASWTDDATSGVDGTKTYTHAYSFGSAVNTTINGIVFTGVGGVNPSSPRFSTTGLGSVFNNDGNNVTGGSRQLANDFLYNGFPASITINGLVPGAEYVATIYSVGWENGTRAGTFNVGSDRLTVNQDHFGDNNGIRFIHRYIATASSITLTYSPLEGNSIHTYGFSNYELSPPAPPQIVNASFEADNFSVFPGYVGGNGPITGWSALANHGVNPGTFGGPFADNGAIPNGSKVAFLQQDGQMSQVIRGFVVGSTYQIRYYENARSGNAPSCEVKISGNTIVATHAVPPVGGSNPYREVLSAPFVATFSALELAFIKSNPLGGDTTLLIDNVSIILPNTPPTFNVQPQDQIAGLGETATFSASASGSQPLTYQWYFGVDPLPGATSTTLDVFADFPDVAGSYYVVVANSAGSLTSRVATLTVRASVPGMFNTGVDANKVALPDGVVDPHYTLVVNADGASPNAIVEDSATFPIVAGPWVANNASGKWIGPRFNTAAAAGLATGGGVYVYRLSFDLTGLDFATVVITGSWAVDNAGLGIGVNGVATGLVNNNGFASLTPFTISSANATFVSGINTLEFAVRNDDAAAGYTGLRVANLRGLATLPNTPPSILTQPQGQTAGTGENVTFTVVAAGSSPLGYQWKHETTNLPGANGPSLTLNNLTHADAGVYSVTVSNAAGMLASSNAVLVVRDSVGGFFNTGVDASRVALADGATDPHYRLLQNADSSSPDAIVESSALFPIVAGPWVPNDAASKWIGPRLDTAGAAAGDYTYRFTVDLTGFDPASIEVLGEWSTDNGGIDIFVNGIASGNVNTVQFVAYTAFRLTNGFTAGPNTIDFKLNNAGPDPGWTGLRVRAFRGLGTLLPPGTRPFIVRQPQDVCANLGDVASFSVIANGSAPLGYQWYFGVDPVANETNSTFSVLVDFPDVAGQYSVKISNAAGMTNSRMALITINIPPVVPARSLATAMNTPATVPPSKFLNNVTDPDGGSVSLHSVATTSAQGGGIALNAGLYTYTPPAGYTGSDSFTFTIRDSCGGLTVGTMDVLVLSGALPTQNQVLLVHTANSFIVRFAGIPGHAYQIQRSTDLSVWTLLATRTAPAHGIIEYEDVTALPAAFYRTAAAP